MFFPEIHSLLQGFQVHHPLKLQHPLISHTGALFHQLLVIFYPGFLSLALNNQVIILPPFIGKTDVKAKIPVINLLKIRLADVISADGNMTKRHGIMVLILDKKLCLRIQFSPQNPAVQCHGIFSYTDYINLVLHP